MFAVRVRQLVSFVSVFCKVCLVSVLIARAAGAAPSEPVSAVPSTTHFLDLSSPALFPGAPGVFPSNIDAPPYISNLMREMWSSSPTFRRQCLRIARANGGRVSISFRKMRSTEVRAVSLIARRKAGQWLAEVEVFIDTDLPEMIAHELEHVIEQIDGVDLPRLARQGMEGVSPGSGDHYETARAVAAGKRVAREYAGRNRTAS